MLCQCRSVDLDGLGDTVEVLLPESNDEERRGPKVTEPESVRRTSQPPGMLPSTSEKQRESYKAGVPSRFSIRNQIRRAGSMPISITAYTCISSR